MEPKKIGNVVVVLIGVGGFIFTSHSLPDVITNSAPMLAGSDPGIWPAVLPVGIVLVMLVLLGATIGGGTVGVREQNGGFNPVGIIGFCLLLVVAFPLIEFVEEREGAALARAYGPCYGTPAIYTQSAGVQCGDGNAILNSGDSSYPIYVGNYFETINVPSNTKPNSVMLPKGINQLQSALSLTRRVIGSLNISYIITVVIAALSMANIASGNGVCDHVKLRLNGRWRWP